MRLAPALLFLVSCRGPDWIAADREFERTPAQVVDAVTIALCDVDARVEKIERTAESARVTALRSDGVAIDVRVLSLGEGFTRMIVLTTPERAGIVGFMHERVSEELVRGPDPILGTPSRFPHARLFSGAGSNH
jgi:hypothetical protein